MGLRVRGRGNRETVQDLRVSMSILEKFHFKRVLLLLGGMKLAEGVPCDSQIV